MNFRDDDSQTDFDVEPDSEIDFDDFESSLDLNVDLIGDDDSRIESLRGNSATVSPDSGHELNELNFVQEPSDVMESVSTDSIVPDDFDDTDFENPGQMNDDLTLNEGDGAGTADSKTVLPDQVQAGHPAEPPVSSSDESGNPLIKSVDKSVERSATTTDDKRSIFSRFHGWFKLTKRQPAKIKSPAENETTDSVPELIASPGTSFEFSESFGEDFDFAKSSTIDIASTPTEEVSRLDAGTYFDNLKTVNPGEPVWDALSSGPGMETEDPDSTSRVFELGQPFSTPAEIAPSHQESEGDSAEEFDYSTDAVMDSDIELLTQKKEFDPTQPTATDTLYDPDLRHSLCDSPPVLDARKFQVDGAGTGVFGETEFVAADESDSAMRQSAAADTIRETSPTPADPAIEKERFSTLQSQVDELERENELLNKSLLMANREVERIVQLATEMTQLQEQLEIARQKNVQLESELATLKRELENSQAIRESSDSPMEQQELHPSSDSAPQPGDTDPDFLRRFELRLKQEYKKRRQAERELAQAEEQRNELAKTLSAARRELNAARSSEAKADRPT